MMPIVPKVGLPTILIEARLSVPSGSTSLPATLTVATDPTTTSAASLFATGGVLPGAGGGGGGGAAPVPLSLRMSVGSRCEPPSDDFTSTQAGAVGTLRTVSAPVASSTP